MRPGRREGLDTLDGIYELVESDGNFMRNHGCFSAVFVPIFHLFVSLRYGQRV